ncbi:hypothetical protein [Clostridium perfringens]|uniref:hypothetical protein n=1 Tax=Clostridium perfringens TaxID=1502 RepID=UPI0039EBC202
MKKFFEIPWKIIKFLFVISLILRIFRFTLFSFIPTFYAVNYSVINLVILSLSIYMSYYFIEKIDFIHLND